MPKYPMPRASEDFLGSIHALVGEEIRDMLTDVDLGSVEKVYNWR